MTIQTAITTDVRYVKETTWGVTPTAATLQSLARIDSSLDLNKAELKSKIVRSDRKQSETRLGVEDVQGDITSELMMEGQDDLIAAALLGTWATPAAVTDVHVDATASSVIGNAGDFANYWVGDIVTTSGFTNAGNNGSFRVQTKSNDGSTITIAPSSGATAALVTETAAVGNTVAFAGKRTHDGVTESSFSVEYYLPNLPSGQQFKVFSGLRANKLSQGLSPSGLVSFSVSFMGQKMVMNAASASAGGGSVLPAIEGDLFSPIDGTLWQDGAPMAFVTDLKWDVDNGYSGDATVGSKHKVAMFPGTSTVTGSVTIYVSDNSFLTKFVNEVEVSLDVLVAAKNGTDFHKVQFPRALLTKNSSKVSATGGITMQCSFTALPSVAHGGNQVVYQVSNA